MPCEHDLLRIAPYIDGELPRGEREDVQSRIDACEDCRRVAEEFRRLDELAAGRHPPRVTAPEWENALATVRFRARASGESRRWIAVASIAALFLIGAVIWSFGTPFGETPAPKDPVVRPSDPTAPSAPEEEKANSPRWAERPDGEEGEIPVQDPEKEEGRSRLRSSRF